MISAVATAPDELGEAVDEVWDDADDGGDEDHVELALAPPPPLGGDGGTAVEAGLTRRDEKQQLRDANARAARELARRTGLTHAEVNAELNRRSGLRRVSEATLAQLEARLGHAERWLVTV